MRCSRRPESSHHGALDEKLSRECFGRLAEIDARAGDSELAEGRVRVKHGEHVAGIP